MCSRKWLRPFSAGVSKRDPTRDQSATCARWSCGCGTTTTRSPLARVALVASPLILILVIGGATARASVHLGFLDEAGVDLDVVLGLLAEAADVERERLVALV